MSTETPKKGHRHTRSAATPSAAASSQNPQNPHYLNLQAHAQNSELEMNYPIQPTTPPRTPRRDNQQASHNKSSAAAPENGSKQKPRNKNRPKNVNTSPAATKNDRRTPPLTSAQPSGMTSSAKPITTPSTAAYAGPTFHASPAPSALPIPSFYSKSVPDSPGMKGVKTLREVSQSSNSGSSTPPAPAPNNQFRREESPLDFFFKADREEKARARSASSTQTAAIASGPFQPPILSPRNSQTPPAPTSHTRARVGHTPKSSASGMFAMELDGPNSPGTPFGAAFSTPYSERINAARAGKNSTMSPDQINTQQSKDRTEALKAYLFSGHALPSTAAANSTGPTGLGSPVSNSSTSYRNGHCPTNGPPRPQYSNTAFANDIKGTGHVPRSSGRSSGLRQEVTPTKTPISAPGRNMHFTNSPTPSRVYGGTSSHDTNDFIGKSTAHVASPVSAPSYGVSSGDRTADLQGMEDSLRKILKLDSAGSSGVTGSPIGSISAAAVSVPNYVGGRPPSMNGMRNGVMGS